VQKVAGLPRRDSSQPDWKFLHQRRDTNVPKEQSQGEEMKLKTSHEETIEKTSKLTAKESTTSLGHAAKRTREQSETLLL